MHTKYQKVSRSNKLKLFKNCNSIVSKCIVHIHAKNALVLSGLIYSLFSEHHFKCVSIDDHRHLPVLQGDCYSEKKQSLQSGSYRYLFTDTVIVVTNKTYNGN